MKKCDNKTTEHILSLIRSDTYSIAEICKMAHISRATFYNWQKENPAFAHAISEAREQLRQMLVCEAEKSLLKKVQGYTVDEIKVKTVPGRDENGEPVQKVLEQTTITKHIPPDTTAIIFTLTNREPETWKSRYVSEVSGVSTLPTQESVNALIELTEKFLKA